METNPESHTEPRPNTDRKHDTNHSDGTLRKPPKAYKEELKQQERDHSGVYVNGDVVKDK